MVMDTAPETKIRAIERLGASIVRATYDECWRTVEAHGSERMTRLLRSSVRRRSVHRRQRHRRARDLRGSAGRGRDRRAARRRRTAGRHRRGASRDAAATRVCTPPNRKPPRRCPLRSRPGEPVYFEGLDRVVRRRRRRQVGARRRCGRCSAAVRIDRRLARRGGAAMRARGRARARHRRRRGRMRRRRGAQRRARAAGRSSPSCRAATSISPRFASLVGPRVTWRPHEPSIMNCAVKYPTLSLFPNDQSPRRARHRSLVELAP